MEKQPIILMNLKDVIKKIALSRSTIYRKLNPKDKSYDSTFPRPRKIGKTANRWVLSEVEAWLEKQLTFNQR
jgi:prophage regulatory protein